MKIKFKKTNEEKEKKLNAERAKIMIRNGGGNQPFMHKLTILRNNINSIVAVAQ